MFTEADIEIARKAIEDELIDRRDDRIGLLMVPNGLVIREENGIPSAIVRMTTREAVKIGLNAISEAKKNA